MKRLFPLALATSLLIATAVVVTFAYGSDATAESKASGRQASDSPAVAAMCTQDNPDCNDTAFGGGGSETSDACITIDASGVCPVPVCDTVPQEACNYMPPPDGAPIPVDPGDGIGDGVSTFDVTVPFDTSVTQDDTKLANEVVLSFDPNASFVIQESFPPTGFATVTTATSDFCAAIEAKLEGIPSVHGVTCVPAASEPPCCKPDVPVSTEPGSSPGDVAPDAPGVNPSEQSSPPNTGSGSAQDSGPASR